MPTYPKRLIEVDLPIKRISAHARREKSIRHGHISTLHIWWARRPLAACRAVICAALWPDPADPICPPVFRKATAKIILDFARKITADTKLANDHCSPENYKLWRKLTSTSAVSLQPLALRQALLDFIADFANWDNSTVREYLDTSRALTQAAHEALGGAPGTRPLVVDPFCGGGSIPLEALRVGADAFASDLNPVPVLLNKVVLEYIPKYANVEFRFRAPEGYEAVDDAKRLECADSSALSDTDQAGQGGGGGKSGDQSPHSKRFAPSPAPAGPEREVVLHGLAEAVRYWGNWIKQEAEKELAEFYPKDPDGATPIAYLWARTIQCEGPGCGAEVPLIRSLWLAKKANRSVALQLVPRPRAKRVDFQIIVKQRGGWVGQDDPKTKIEDPKFDGTVKAGSATCPCCNYTTAVERVREQFKKRNGGSQDARLICVATFANGSPGKQYRLPRPADVAANDRAASRLRETAKTSACGHPVVPDEPTPPDGTGSRGGGYRTRKYGITDYGHFFNTRQLVQHLVISAVLRRVRDALSRTMSEEEARAVQTIVALTADRQLDRDSAFCRWIPQTQAVGYTFGRQAIPMLWDFVESPAFFSSGGWQGCFEDTCQTLETLRSGLSASGSGHSESASATNHPLPDDSCVCLFTDPPYYDSVPYAELSDFFFVWLKRSIGDIPPIDQFPALTSREKECVVNLAEGKDKDYFQRTMTASLAEGRRFCRPDGIGVIVFAHKSTAGWESQLQALLDAGWVITASWPIDTERAGRLRAIGSAALASSVHLVCRPRENPDGSVRTDEVGDWRDVLAELPRRIHDWMPRLAEEGVVGADAIFACLGPALEVFSRYSRVEKASGEAVPLKEYLEQVWAAVAKEALTMIFSGADTAAFEEDARLTAMWLWTLKTGESTTEGTESTEEGQDSEDNEAGKPGKANSGFVLEFDAARKIAQGLGAHLEDLASLVAVEGETARLLPVAERARTLFGKDEGREKAEGRRLRAKGRSPQMDLFAATPDADSLADAVAGPSTINSQPSTLSVLDRVHQSMILFAASRGEALKRFLVEDAAGNDARFWTLAQALSALYPASTDEKRWVDGVLARKKGLGF